MGFWSGLKDGFVGAAEGTWEGTKALAKGGYALATDPAAREKAWEATKSAANAVGDYAGKVYDDPAKIYRDARDGASAAYTAAEGFVREADAEDWGKLVGGGAFEVGTALIPVGALAKAGKLSKVAKAGDTLGDAAKTLDKVEDIGDAVDDAADAAKTLGKAKVGVVERCIEVQKGTNKAKWEVDAQGRPVSVEARLKEKAGGEKRSYAEQKTQKSVGKSGTDGDEGGHLIGHRFMDDQGAKNLIPQNANLNKSAYKKMENEWADWIDNDKEIIVKINLEPPGAQRPDNILVEYDVIDPSSGEMVFSRKHNFSNQAGESFERLSKADMANL